ncbi:MAG: hypothetical protein RL685_6974 [Pseudomonadota bacterium]
MSGRSASSTAPNRAWVGDVTFIPTAEGWLYLAVLIDLFSRRVVGWATSDTNTPTTALSRWRPCARPWPSNTQDRVWSTIPIAAAPTRATTIAQRLRDLASWPA